MKKSELINRARNNAVDERAKLNIGPYEPIDIFKLLKNQDNISVVIAKLEGEISGFFLRKNTNSMIVLNANRSLGHQYFTAAHEYYHLKYEVGLSARICPIKNFDEDYESEIEANHFASFFLMPDDSLRYHLSKRLKGRDIEIADLIFLENYFMVSHALMLRKLKEIGLISDTQYSDMRLGIISLAKKLGYQTTLYEKTEIDCPIIISEYAELANRLFMNGKISNGKYEELLIDGGYFDLIINAQGDMIDEETISF